jgi:demethylmenaquinone methyltransferase/2-methoxy-6-polyprenyl-1,4-benzoquinol methylase
MEGARRKPLPEGRVEFRAVDAYTLQGLGEETFDGAFAGCWWSHVPLKRLSHWLDTLHSALEPGARVVMLDNSFVQTISTPISRTDDAGNTYQTRPLDDSSTHEVLKNFPSPEAAIAALGPRARDPQWMAYTHYWVLSYGVA